MKIFRVLALTPLFNLSLPAAPNKEPSDTESRLEHAFTFKIKGTSSEAEFSPRGAREGTLIGSGRGTVDGRLKGTVRWSLYENSTDFACTMQFVGEVLTEEGVTIPFEGQGIAIVPDGDFPSHWKTGGVFRFDPGAGAYSWLRNVLVPWQGETNLDAMEAQLSFHLPTIR